jgi:hypothetical protein
MSPNNPGTRPVRSGVAPGGIAGRKNLRQIGSSTMKKAEGLQTPATPGATESRMELIWQKPIDGALEEVKD